MVIWAETEINHITQFIDDAKSGTEQTAKKLAVIHTRLDVKKAIDSIKTK